jgi:hypothetical protein
VSFNNRSQTSINLEEATNEFNKMHKSIQTLLYKLGDECDNIRYDRGDLDQDFLRGQYHLLADKLDSIEKRLTYLSKPVVEQGYIRHNDLDRYELPSGTYFTSGSSCEILITRYDEQYWVYTSIEHNGSDYYATAVGINTSINGMMVRIRGESL